MTQPAAFRWAVGQVHRVDGFSMDRDDLLVQEGVEEAALNRVESLDGKMIVEGHAVMRRDFVRETGEARKMRWEYEQGAHLGMWVTGQEYGMRRDRLTRLSL